MIKRIASLFFAKLGALVGLWRYLAGLILKYNLPVVSVKPKSNLALFVANIGQPFTY